MDYRLYRIDENGKQILVGETHLPCPIPISYAKRDINTVDNQLLNIID